MRKVFLRDLEYHYCPGSKLSYYRIKNFFRYNNYDIVDSPAKANHVILNTCGTAIEFEDIHINDIIHVKATSPELESITVFGCLAGPSTKLTKLADYIIPTKKEHLFDNFFSHKVSITDISGVDASEKMSADLSKKQGKKRYFLEVNRGCIHNCSYCGIKKAIGHVKSKPIADILDEAKAALDDGYTSFMIVTDDVGSYGYDIGTNFAQMFNALCGLSDTFDMEIYYTEPSEWIKAFPLIKDNVHRIYEMTYPAQSFSNRILKLMRRKYTVEEFIKSAQDIKDIHPQMFLRNQIIYNYPTETFEEFKENLKFSHLFGATDFQMYSAIPGTKKFEESDILSKEEKLRRMQILYQLNKIKGDSIHLKLKYNFMKEKTT